MRKLQASLIILILLGLCTLSYGHGNGLADTYTHLGKGCTTAYYIDDDCDGYGVGAVYTHGPDADDTDATVNTSATVISKYGGTEAAAIPYFITTVKGYAPLNYVVLDPVNGTSGGVRSPNFATAVANPFMPRPTFQAGDCIVLRGGTYTAALVGSGYFFNLTTGTAANPIIVVPYPGEMAILNPTSQSFDGNYFTVDGFGGGIRHRNLANSNSQYFHGVTRNNFTFKEFEFSDGHPSYPGHFISSSHVLIEKCILANSSSHIMYFTANPSTLVYQGHDITIRGCIFYHNIPAYGDFSNYGPISFNGGYDGVLVENNIFHGNYGSSCYFTQGAKNITIRNNVGFNIGKFFQLYYYQTWYTMLPLPFDNILIENNSFWHGNKRIDGGALQWPIIAYDMAGEWVGTTWQANHTYPAPATYTDFVKRLSGDVTCVYINWSAGISGASEPSWSVVTGGTVVDGTVTWHAWCAPSVSNVVIRNNILQEVGTSSADNIFLWHNVRGFSYEANIEYPTIEYNVLYRDGSPSTGAQTWADYNGFTAIYTYYNFAQFQALDPTKFHDNIYGNPLFIYTNVADYANPGPFNLEVPSGSPAINTGSWTGLPATDIRGNYRYEPDIGAYTFGGSAPYIPFQGIESRGASFR